MPSILQSISQLLGVIYAALSFTCLSFTFTVQCYY